MEIHKELGHGFLEVVYKKAIEINLRLLINFGRSKLEYKRLVF